MNKIVLGSLIVLSAIAGASASDYIEQGTTSEVYARNYYERGVANCDSASMRQELDRATAYGRAVTTVIKCDMGSNARNAGTTEYRQAVATAPAQVYKSAPRVRVNTCGGDCGTPFEVVKNRKYFVTETREVYKPVVNYVSAGTYTTTREVCGTDCE